MNSQKTYLGDGAYAENTGWDIRIYTERENGTHFIHLSATELVSLINFAISSEVLPIKAVKYITEQHGTSDE